MARQRHVRTINKYIDVPYKAWHSDANRLLAGGGKKMSSPVKKFSLGGVQVAIWENESKEGTKFSTVTLSRAYKDKKDEWKNTGSLRTSDLPKAALGLQKAYEHLTLKEPQETA